MSEQGSEGGTRTTLVGHDSEATAYVVADYPYGFRLRCAITTKHGQRLVSQTSNPKRGGIWNKPKKGVYHSLAIMTLDGEGHVGIDCVQAYASGEERVRAFAARHAAALTSDYAARTIKILTACARTSSKVTRAEEAGARKEGFDVKTHPRMFEAKNARTETRDHESGDRFVRTALVVGHGDEGGSLDVVDRATGTRLGQINIFVDEDGTSDGGRDRRRRSVPDPSRPHVRPRSAEEPCGGQARRGALREEAMRRTPLEIVEDLATSVHGPGAAVSVDRERGGIAVRVWDEHARLVKLVREPTKAASLAMVRRTLETKARGA